MNRVEPRLVQTSGKLIDESIEDVRAYSGFTEVDI